MRGSVPPAHTHSRSEVTLCIFRAVVAYTHHTQQASLECEERHDDLRDVAKCLRHGTRTANWVEGSALAPRWGSWPVIALLRLRKLCPAMEGTYRVQQAADGVIAVPARTRFLGLSSRAHSSPLSPASVRTPPCARPVWSSSSACRHSKES